VSLANTNEVAVDLAVEEINAKGGINGKKIKVVNRPVFPVKAHQRQVNIPERAPFRTGIIENLTIIENELAREITTSMKGTA
jgi:DNA-directed RNA polymerase beta' subunit